MKQPDITIECDPALRGYAVGISTGDAKVPMAVAVFISDRGAVFVTVMVEGEAYPASDFIGSEELKPGHSYVYQGPLVEVDR